MSLIESFIEAETPLTIFLTDTRYSVLRATLPVCQYRAIVVTMNVRRTSVVSSNIFKHYHRWGSLIIGAVFGSGLIIGGIALIVHMVISKPHIISIFVLVQVVVFLLGIGLIALSLSIVVFVRQRTGHQGPQSKIVYQDGTGDAIQYVPPQSTGLDYMPEDETIIDILSPITANGTTSIALLGRRTIHNWENTLLLTRHHLIAIQFPATDGGIDGDGLTDAVATLFAASAMDAATKNLFTSMLTGNTVSKAAARIIASKNLHEILRDYQSYVMPLKDITHLGLVALGNIKVQLNDGTSHTWMCPDQARRDAFLASVNRQGMLVVRA